MRFLYTLLLYLLLPIMLLREQWRARRGHARTVPACAAPLSDRFGCSPIATPGALWVHGVSVGETMAAVPLVEALLASGQAVLMTSTTRTGAEQARERFTGRIQHRFMPFDTPGAVARFLDRARPCALVILETELWPNLLHACRQRKIPVLLVNARLSEKSARGYSRFGGLARDMLEALTAVSTQTAADAARFLALGVPAQRLHVNGNLKFDIAVDESRHTQALLLRAGFGTRPVWIAASTHAGEEEIVLAAHRELRRCFPEALLVLVPRHPERFDAVAALVLRSGFSCARRSHHELPSAHTMIYLGDTMGELPLLYGLADVAFVGGSLVPTGGHNLVEPAALGLPILAGPHLFNFQQIADDLAAVGVLRIVAGQAELATQVKNLFADKELRCAIGTGARDYVVKNRGACTRTLKLVTTAIARTQADHSPDVS